MGRLGVPNRDSWEQAPQPRCFRNDTEKLKLAPLETWIFEQEASFTASERAIFISPIDAITSLALKAGAEMLRLKADQTSQLIGGEAPPPLIHLIAVRHRNPLCPRREGFVWRYPPSKPMLQFSVLVPKYP
jgi:hypothetical protein